MALLSYTKYGKSSLALFDQPAHVGNVKAHLPPVAQADAAQQPSGHKAAQRENRNAKYLCRVSGFQKWS
jgi:hypothetical protein